MMMKKKEMKEMMPKEGLPRTKKKEASRQASKRYRSK
jgi:hypothetical protein